MTTKIEKAGLSSVVKSIVEDNPDISDQRVADKLKNDFADRINGNISWYAVRNFRQKLKKNNLIERSSKENKDLTEVAIEEFNEILKDGAKKAETIYDRAIAEDDLNTALRGLEQIRKNWVSMMEFAEKHVIQPLQQINITQKKQIILMLQQYNEVLCPRCKEKIHEEQILVDSKKKE